MGSRSEFMSEEYRVGRVSEAPVDCVDASSCSWADTPYIVYMVAYRVCEQRAQLLRYVNEKIIEFTTFWLRICQEMRCHVIFRVSLIAAILSDDGLTTNEPTAATSIPRNPRRRRPSLLLPLSHPYQLRVSFFVIGRIDYKFLKITSYHTKALFK